MPGVLLRLNHEYSNRLYVLHEEVTDRQIKNKDKRQKHDGREKSRTSRSSGPKKRAQILGLLEALQALFGPLSLVVRMGRKYEGGKSCLD
jgi:hypothetical protein